MDGWQTGRRLTAIAQGLCPVLAQQIVPKSRRRYSFICDKCVIMQTPSFRILLECFTLDFRKVGIHIMKKKVFALSALLLASCQTGDETYVGPSGRNVNNAKCSTSPQGCFKTAAEVCKGPYRVVASHSNAGGLLADVLPGPVTWYNMPYECGASDGRYPDFQFRGASHVIPQSTTTTCSRFGNSVSCNSF